MSRLTLDLPESESKARNGEMASVDAIVAEKESELNSEQTQVTTDQQTNLRWIFAISGILFTIFMTVSIPSVAGGLYVYTEMIEMRTELDMVQASRNEIKAKLDQQTDAIVELKIEIRSLAKELDNRKP